MSGIKEIDLSFETYSLNRHNLIKTSISADFSIVEVVVYISGYAIPIRIKNMYKPEPNLPVAPFTSGAFGSCYKVSID